MYYVYKITRKDGMSYIGITLHLKKREREHLKTKRFEMGITSMEVLYETDSYEDCGEMEEKMIALHDTHKNGLNITATGKGLLKNADGKAYNTLGHKYSDETRKKMSQQRKGLLAGERNGMFGQTHSNKARENMSAKKKGKTWITDGNISRLVDPALPIPEGWQPGKTQIIDKEAAKKRREGKIFITNGRECFSIDKSDFLEWQNKGYERGMISKNIHIEKDGEKKKVSIFDLQSHLDAGWIRVVTRDRLAERDARRKKLNAIRDLT